MPPERPLDPGARSRTDRRKRPTSPWDAFRVRGKRRRLRRVEERHTDYFTDQFEAINFVLVILLLTLTLVDGGLTLILLGTGCEEANPAMRYLLHLGPIYFVLGKYILTSAGLPFLLIYRKYALFQTRFRVGHLFPLFVSLYFLLLIYQITLIGEGFPPGVEPTDSHDRRQIQRAVLW